jgi:hypothetical protein
MFYSRALLLVLLITPLTAAQTGRDVAARFAPVFYQALGDNARSDYITNFDFDGDWRGDNNWANAANKKFPLRAYVYYAVTETATHHFIHYAVFHPRDYKGGERKGVILSELIRLGTERAGERDPTGMLDEAAVAHENDLEGALVVVEKKTGRVAYAESLHHNKFSPYKREDFKAEGQHILLYIEPKGHGIEAHNGNKLAAGKKFLIYKYTGKADDPDKKKKGAIGYELLPLETTLWPQAAVAKDKSAAYGTFHDYGEISINLLQADGKAAEKKFKVGDIGSAFLGKSGGQNMARPPWAWFDNSRRSDPLGLWFFDPAATVKRDFKLGDGFSTAYVRPPFWAKDPQNPKPKP